MHAAALALATLLTMPAVAGATPATAPGAPDLDASDAHALVHVRGDQPARLEVACLPLHTDFDDAHAHGDQLCVLVLEQAGQVALLGQWTQGGEAPVAYPRPEGPELQVARTD